MMDSVFIIQKEVTEKRLPNNVVNIAPQITKHILQNEP